MGPIDRTEGAARTRWLQEQFGSEGYERAADIDAFWSEIALPDNRVITWVSRRNPRDFCGLLEMLRRRGSAPLEIVDVTDIEVPSAEGAPDLEKTLGIAELGWELTVERKLLETAAPISVVATLEYAQTWTRLREENAALRIVENGILRSAPVTHYDGRLVSFARPEWQSIGRVLDPFYQTARAEGLSVPDLRFLLRRLAALVESAQLEAQGDLSSLESYSKSSLRRPLH